MSQGDVNRAVAVLTAGLTVTIRIHLLPKSDPEQTLAKLRLVRSWRVGAVYLALDEMVHRLV